MPGVKNQRGFWGDFFELCVKSEISQSLCCKYNQHDLHTAAQQYDPPFLSVVAGG